MVPFFVQFKCELGQSYAVANAIAEAEIASEIYSTAGDFDLLEAWAGPDDGERAQSAEDLARRSQTLRDIEIEIQALPPRQREAFLMRYWEEMDVAETAAAMGCSEGSVKTHCFRAVQALSKALKAKGIEP